MKRLINFFILLFTNLTDLINSLVPKVYVSNIMEQPIDSVSIGQTVMSKEGLAWVTELSKNKDNNWVTIKLMRRKSRVRGSKITELRRFSIYNPKLGKVLFLIDSNYPYIYQSRQSIEYTVTRSNKAKLTKRYEKKYNHIYLFQTMGDTRNLMNMILSQYKLIKK